MYGDTDRIWDEIRRLQDELHKLKDQPVQPWQEYTPVWTASVTNPVVGNGILTGRFRRQGEDLHLLLYLQAGSTTTFGNGNWSFSLPMPAKVDGGYSYYGVCHCRDAAVRSYARLAQISPGVSPTVLTYFVECSTDSNVVQLTSAVPWAWATGDTMGVDIWYRTAAF